MIRCPVCGTENLDVQYACGVCSAPLAPRRPTRWSSLRSVRPRTWRRVGWALGFVGAVLVIAAIPTNSRIIVLVGLILVGLAHLILIVPWYALRRRR